MTQKSVTLTRRHLFELGAGFAGTSMLVAAGATPATASSTAKYPKAPDWVAYLGKSAQGGRNYKPEVKGKIPEGLRGVLYRNGPGLFERGPHRKAHLLDGDGIVQRLAFTDNGVHYRNEFVRTPKFIAEEEAGELLYATWTTRAPGGVIKNMGGHSIEGQAGVTVYPVGDKIYALDEGNPIFELDPTTLETRGSMRLGGENAPGGIKAHTKFDPVTGEWLSVGVSMGRRMQLHTISYAKNGKLNYLNTFESPRQCYFHDFFISENYFIFVLHPLELQAMKFLAGTHSFTDALKWSNDKETILAVYPRSGGEAKFFDVPASFMWHSLNAYEENGSIIADFSAFDEPDHFVGEDALMYNVMNGYMGKMEHPGKARRYIIDVAGGKAREEIISDGNYEFAMADPRVYGQKHQYGYFASGGLSDLTTGISRIDYNSMDIASYDFPTPTHVGEPVYVEKPGGKIDEGWLICQCLDSKELRTFFAIFDAQSIASGPVAQIWLDHHMPISFHGAWKSA